MEKTAAEYWVEEDEHKREGNEAHEKLDLVEREITHLRNQIDELRTKIRNLENEARDWKKIIRTKSYLAGKAHKLGWSVRNSGL